MNYNTYRLLLSFHTVHVLIIVVAFVHLFHLLILLFLQLDRIIVDVDVEEIMEEGKCVFLFLLLLLFHLLKVDALEFSIFIPLNVLEERFELEPSIEALVLVFSFNQVKEVMLVQVFQLYVLLLGTRWLDFVPLKEAVFR